ncbi:MAG: porin [Burkholderiales bacterium]|nr:porin [Burkholderiales bacterium]
MQRLHIPLISHAFTRTTLVALAAAGAAATASAQSSVAVFGILDTALTWGRGTGAGSADRFQVSTGSYNTSRIGFRGTEDLGGGLSASFWLEAGLNTDDGTGQASNTNNQSNGGGASGSCTVTGATPAAAGTPVACSSTVALNGTQSVTFNRRSTVSLAGNWGEIRLGRDYVPQYWNRSTFDPFGVVGVGQNVIHTLAITGVTSVRASNSVGYLLPRTLGGFYGQAMYYAGENLSSAATHRDGSGYGVRLGFTSGPFNMAVATGSTRYAAGRVRQSNVGGQWNFGVGRLMAQYEAEANGANEAKGWLVGGLVPVGPGEVRLAYSRMTIDPASSAMDRRSSKVAVGYVHNLSKRTALYGTLAHVSNSGGATLGLGGSVTAANSSSRGLDVGIRHSF